MWKLPVFLFLILFSCGCTFFTKGKIETAIGNKIQKDCVINQNCSININELTWFDWDNMLVFSEGFTDIDKNQVLGEKYFKESRFGSEITLVFFKNGEIVYSEENFREIEGYRNGDIYFSDIDSLNHYQKYPLKSVFEVKREKLNDGEYYSMQCQNCNE